MQNVARRRLHILHLKLEAAFLDTIGAVQTFQIALICYLTPLLCVKAGAIQNNTVGSLRFSLHGVVDSEMLNLFVQILVYVEENVVHKLRFLIENAYHFALYVLGGVLGFVIGDGNILFL